MEFVTTIWGGNGVQEGSFPVVNVPGGGGGGEGGGSPPWSIFFLSSIPPPDKTLFTSYPPLIKIWSFPPLSPPWPKNSMVLRKNQQFFEEILGENWGKMRLFF